MLLGRSETEILNYTKIAKLGRIKTVDYTL